MATCPTCHLPATTRDGFDRRGRQRFACHPCHRDFTQASSGAFSGYRTTVTGQRFLKGFEAMQALRRGDVALRCLVPG